MKVSPGDQEDRLREWHDDPELGDENDPEYKEEMFETYLAMGWTPDDLADPNDREEYAAWLRERGEAVKEESPEH